MNMAATRARGYHGRFIAEPPEQRFWSRVAKGEGCWLWQGGYSSNGYGRFQLGPGKGIGAHRFAYESAVGDIPPKREIDHLCRNRGCVNPGHMEIVTTKQNTLRGNGPTARNARKTHCPQGHPYNLINTKIKMRRGRAGRYCRVCHREHSRRWRARQKEQA